MSNQVKLTVQDAHEVDRMWFTDTPNVEKIYVEEAFPVEELQQEASLQVIKLTPLVGM